jgi:hypothetical protein
MTGSRDLQPRLKRFLHEAGFRVAIMRAKSVKTKDRLAWMEREGKKNDISISHPQLVQTGVDFFGKRPGSHNFSAIAFYETGTTPSPGSRQLVVPGGSARGETAAWTICTTRRRSSNGRWPGWLQDGRHDGPGR